MFVNIRLIFIDYFYYNNNNVLVSIIYIKYLHSYSITNAIIIYLYTIYI